MAPTVLNPEAKFEIVRQGREGQPVRGRLSLNSFLFDPGAGR